MDTKLYIKKAYTAMENYRQHLKLKHLRNLTCYSLSAQRVKYLPIVSHQKILFIRMHIQELHYISRRLNILLRKSYKLFSTILYDFPNHFLILSLRSLLLYQWHTSHPCLGMTLHDYMSKTLYFKMAEPMPTPKSKFLGGNRHHASDIISTAYN